VHLGDNSSLIADLQLPSLTSLQQSITAAMPSAPASNASSSFDWNSLLKTVGNVASTGLQVYGAVQQSQNLARVGINPIGYGANGLPVYGSTPSGVTPNNPYSLPSGSALPYGVTPNYSIMPGGTTITSQTVNPLANLLSGNTGMYLMLGGTAIFVLMMLQKKRR